MEGEVWMHAMRSSDGEWEWLEVGALTKHPKSDSASNHLVDDGSHNIPI